MTMPPSGGAFKADQEAVIAAIQTLRQDAYARGVLDSNEYQTVAVEQQGNVQVVVIQPPKPPGKAMSAHLSFRQRRILVHHDRELTVAKCYALVKNSTVLASADRHERIGTYDSLCSITMFALSPGKRDFFAPGGILSVAWFHLTLYS